MKVEFSLLVLKRNRNCAIVSNKGRILPNFSFIAIIIGRLHFWYQIHLIYSLISPFIHFNIHFILYLSFFETNANNIMMKYLMKRFHETHNEPHNI